MTASTAIQTLPEISTRIYPIRGHPVMLDRDLAELYGVATKALNQAVRRNAARFPAEFAFQLTPEELDHWRSHFVTSNPAALKGLRYRPWVFTEHGAVMLASVLTSERAVQMSILVTKAFIHMRQLLVTHTDLMRRIDALEARYDGQFEAVFSALRELMEPPEEPRRPIGFHTP